MAAKKEIKEPSRSTLKRLFALSGNRCPFPKCTSAIVEGTTVIGEVCHIKGAKSDSARHDPDQSDEDRHGFDNLILICGTHHTVIDDDIDGWPVERLTRLKALHEARQVRIAGDVASQAASLLFVQTKISLAQAGHHNTQTVHVGDVNHYASTMVGVVKGSPSWTFHELFYYIRPTISATDSSTWDEAGQEVLDKLSTGELQAWGREIVRGPTRSLRSLAPIDPTYWRAARFTFSFLLDEHDDDLHVTQDGPSRFPDYADLRVDQDRGVELWPHPLRGRWKIDSVTLGAWYFGKAPDQLTLSCRNVALYDPQIIMRLDATGAATEDIAEPGYFLISGTDTAAVRSLAWKPQELALVEPGSPLERSYRLMGDPDTSFRKGVVKILVDPHETHPLRQISSAVMEKGADLLGARHYEIAAQATTPAILRRGPKLILQALPISALENVRVVDSAAAELLAMNFIPDGIERYEGRPGRDGWTWRQPAHPNGGPFSHLADWYARLDWTGFVEIVKVFDEADAEGNATFLKGGPLERVIVKTFDAIADGYAKLRIQSPVILRVELMDILGKRLLKSRPASDQGFNQPGLVASPLGIVTMQKPLGKHLKPLLDQIWYTAGWSIGSTSFQRGDWEGYTNPIPYRN